MDEIEILKQLGEVPPPSSGAFHRARQVLEDHAAGLGPSVSNGLPAASLSQRRQRWSVLASAVAIGAAAASVVGLTVFGNLGSNHVHAKVDAAARSLLTTAAVKADAASVHLPGPGQYVYAQSEETSLNFGNGFGGHSATYFYQETGTTQTWTASNGAGRTVITYTPATFVSSASQQAWEQSGQPLPTSQNVDQTYGPSTKRASLNLDPIGLPVTPAALLAALQQRYPDVTDPAVLLSTCAQILQEPGLQPGLRSAVFQVLAQTAGISYFGNVSDAAGEQGPAVGLVTDGVRVEYIFDADDATLLAVERVVANPSQLTAPPGETQQQLQALHGEAAGTVLDSQVFFPSATVVVPSTTAPVSAT